MSNIEQNTSDLLEILDMINDLPEAGGGVAKEEQEKTVNITENGTTEITPDSGKTLSKVTVNTNVTDADTVDGWHVDVRSDGSAPPIGMVNTISFVYTSGG